MIQKKIIVNIFFHEITAHENFVKSLQQFLFRFAHFCEYHACIHMHDFIENSWNQATKIYFYFEIRSFHGNFISVKSIDKEISVVRTLLLTHKYVLHHWKSISRIFFTCCVLKKEQKFGSSTFTVWKNEKFSLTVKYFVKSTL